MDQFQLITEEDRRLSAMAYDKFAKIKKQGLIITDSGEI